MTVDYTLLWRQRSTRMARSPGRSANLLVKQHGEDAPIEAAMRADAMLERGDVESYSVRRGRPQGSRKVAEGGAGGRRTRERRHRKMVKPKQDPAMILCAIAGLLVALVPSSLGILPSTGEGGLEGALRAGLVAGAGIGAGLIVWALYRRFRPWQ